jgi:hypothetical protein
VRGNASVRAVKDAAREDQSAGMMRAKDQGEQTRLTDSGLHIGEEGRYGARRTFLPSFSPISLADPNNAETQGPTYFCS